MPKINGVGVSDATFEKQVIIKKIFEKHIYAVNYIINKNNTCKNVIFSKDNTKSKWDNYIYIDATCGNGKYNDIDGSPLIFINILCKVPNLIKKTNCYFIDNRLDALHELRQHIHQDLNGNLKLIHGDYVDRIPVIIENHKNSLGLIYFDPNGIVDLNFIRKLLRLCPMNTVDLLFNYNGTAFKRNASATESGMHFTDYLKKLNKRCWFISTPRGKWQWSFLFGTNTRKLQLPACYGFHNIESDEGKEILKKVDLTKNEMKMDGQSILF